MVTRGFGAPEVVMGLFSFLFEGLSTQDIQAGRRMTVDKATESVE